MKLFLPKMPRFFSDLGHFRAYHYSFFLYFLLQNNLQLSLILQLIDLQSFKNFTFRQKAELLTKCATFEKDRKIFEDF